MDTEEFFIAAFKNSPAVRRAYEDALTQGVPLADHISDAIKFILNMASTAMKMLYEGVGDSIETALSILFRANHLYQKLERGLKFADKWINIRTFVFRTGAILAVCFLFFRQKTIAFLKYFDRNARAWAPHVIKATELPINIGKAVAFAVGLEINNLQKTHFANREYENVLAGELAVKRMLNNKTFIDSITTEKYELLKNTKRQIDAVYDDVEMAVEAYSKEADRIRQKHIGDTTHDPKFSGLAIVKPPTTPNAIQIPDNPEFLEDVEMKFVDGIAQALKGLTVDPYFLEECSLPGNRGIFRDYGGLEYVKLRFIDHLELFVVQFFCGDARRQHYRMHGMDPRKPCSEDVCQPDELILIDQIERKVINPVYSPRALYGYAQRTIGSIMELIGIRNKLKPNDGNNLNHTVYLENVQAEDPQLKLEDPQIHYDANDENVTKLLADKSLADKSLADKLLADKLHANFTPLYNADVIQFHHRPFDGNGQRIFLQPTAFHVGVLSITNVSNVLANASSVLANASNVLLPITAGGEDEEDVD